MFSLVFLICLPFISIIMFLLPVITILCLSLAGSEGKSIKKSHVNLLESTDGLDGDDWQGKWFPYAPGEPHIPQHVQRVQAGETSTSAAPYTDDWKGKWFPYVPGEPHVIKVTPQERQEEAERNSNATKDSWPGKWFPQDPNKPHKLHKKPLKEEKNQLLKETICDDGKVSD